MTADANGAAVRASPSPAMLAAPSSGSALGDAAAGTAGDGCCDSAPPGGHPRFLGLSRGGRQPEVAAASTMAPQCHCPPGAALSPPPAARMG